MCRVPQFGDLEAGRKYSASVTACNSRKCSDAAVQEVWTLPEQARVSGQLQKVDGSSSTITLGLPQLLTLPRWVFRPQLIKPRSH